MAAPDPRPQLDDAACQRALAVLVEVGTALVLECKTPTPDAPLATRSLAYDRIALAVRRAILLSQHIAQAAPARAAHAAHAAQQSEHAAAHEAERAARRRKVIRAVEDTADRMADPAEAAALRRELLERIDSPEFDHDLAHRPPLEVIRELCRDMTLTTGVSARRTPADIALLCARAAAPAGSGLPLWSALALDHAPVTDTARLENDNEPRARPAIAANRR